MTLDLDRLSPFAAMESIMDENVSVPTYVIPSACPHCRMNWSVFPPVNFDDQIMRADGTFEYSPTNGFRCVECKRDYRFELSTEDAGRLADESGSAAILELTREDKMVVLRRDAEGTPTVWCDPEIADIVKALNDGGVATRASCSGHGEQDGSIILRDGRELIIKTPASPPSSVGTWGDKPDQFTDRVHAAHPVMCKDDDRYARHALAMEMIHSRHSKYALVYLVNWLLTKWPELQAEAKR